MLRLRTFIIIVIIYLIAFISIKVNINLLYPYYYLKDIVIYPVIALNKDQELVTSESFDHNYVKGLEEEIEELKKLTNVKNVSSEFTIINASIIERNRSYWFNSLTIDKGLNDGLELDMAVINQDGLIGKINKTSAYTSEIKLITTNDINNKISIVIENNGQKVYGILNGYDLENDYLQITLTTKNIEINEGVLVTTTGMGGVFPRGIIIGKTVAVKEDTYDVGKIVLVKPSVNVKDLKYVGVLKRK